jgi:predicted  nucleic acid-binding Zn-ribbon protein
MNEVQLLKLKSEIDTANKEVSELRGHLNALMKQLKDDWNCKTVAEAQKKLDAMDAEIKQANAKIEQGMAELEKKYSTI